jgi:hypothetical protein
VEKVYISAMSKTILGSVGSPNEYAMLILDESALATLSRPSDRLGRHVGPFLVDPESD